MKVKERPVFEMVIEAGVERGLRRAHKHFDEPTSEQIRAHIVQCIMDEIYEWFDFEDKEPS